MLVQVTQRHITRGRPDSVNGCPIACALLDMGCEHVIVANITAWTKGDQGYWISPTQEMMDFMHDFDSGRPVRPTYFIVEPIAQRHPSRR